MAALGGGDGKRGGIGTRLAAGWLLGIAVGSIAFTATRPGLNVVALPFFFGVTLFLLVRLSRRSSPGYPGTDFERELEQLLSLLLPRIKPTTTATARDAIQREIRVARLKRASRVWAKALEAVTTEGYQTASRISALHTPSGRQHDHQLVARAVVALADPALAADPVAVLAYGLGARPAVDLASLDELLADVGLSDDELRTHFDEVASRCVRARGELPVEHGEVADAAGDAFAARNRTVYRLTTAGREALREWLRRPAGFPKLQHEASFRLFAGDMIEDEEILASIEHLRADIERMSAAVGTNIARAPSLPHRTRYLLLLNDLGRRLLQAHIDWLDTVEAGLASPHPAA